MSKTMPYPHLADLMGGYLHQDWDIEHDDLDSVLDGFAGVSDSTTVKAVAAEVRRFMADHPTDLLASFERTFRPDIIIGSDDVEASKWLKWLAVSLEVRADLSPKSMG